MNVQELKKVFPTYRDWRSHRQKEVNDLPMHWAFGKRQFDELCEELGAKPEDFVQSQRLGGALILKTDWPMVKAYFEQPDTCGELLKDYEWAKSAFLEEMGNHEYHINLGQADYDVFSAFYAVDWAGDDSGPEPYFEQCEFTPDQRRAYLDARREFYKLCDENEWW